MKRLLRRSWSRARRLLSDRERRDLAEALAATVGTAELLGRTRILRRLELSREHGTKHHDLEAFTCFAGEEVISPLVPEEALRYFTGLVPSLDLDPDEWITGLRRRCFTLAVATETTLLERVQGLIASALETGRGISTAPRRIASLLDDAGVSPRSSQYCDMVFRTNMRDAYMQGAQDQLDEVADYFPVWRYIGIRDGRQGDDHEPHFDRYYPSSVPFAKVRGKRVFNCRCDMVALTETEWRDLRRGGAHIAAGYTDPVPA